MDRKEKILKMYYDKGLKITDIANKYKVSKPYVTKIIKQDNRYDREKENRKEQTKNSKRNYTNKKMKEIRSKKMQLDAYVEQQHLQASRELSGGTTIISNRAFRKWNASAYKYNKNKNCYEYDRKLVRTFSTPKFIK